MRSVIKVFLALGLVLVSACYEWRPTSASPTEVVSVRHESTILVTRRDGTQQALRDARVERDSLFGSPFASNSAEVAIPLSDVRSVDTQHLKTGRTTGAVVVLVLVTGVIAAGINFFTSPI